MDAKQCWIPVQLFTTRQAYIEYSVGYSRIFRTTRSIYDKAHDFIKLANMVPISTTGSITGAR